jgi:hypothetical protein
MNVVNKINTTKSINITNSEIIISLVGIYVLSTLYYFLYVTCNEDDTEKLLMGFPELMKNYKKNKYAPIKQLGIVFSGLFLFTLCFRPFRWIKNF